MATVKQLEVKVERLTAKKSKLKTESDAVAAELKQAKTDLAAAKLAAKAAAGAPAAKPAKKPAPPAAPPAPPAP